MSLSPCPHPCPASARGILLYSRQTGAEWLNGCPKASQQDGGPPFPSVLTLTCSASAPADGQHTDGHHLGECPDPNPALGHTLHSLLGAPGARHGLIEASHLHSTGRDTKTPMGIAGPWCWDYSGQLDAEPGADRPCCGTGSEDRDKAGLESQSWLPFSKGAQ